MLHMRCALQELEELLQICCVVWKAVCKGTIFFKKQ